MEPEHHRKDDEKIDLMYNTLFGNKDAGTKGMVEKLDDIHSIFIRMSTGFSLLKWFFGSVIVLGLFLATVKGWLVGVAHLIISQK